MYHECARSYVHVGPDLTRDECLALPHLAVVVVTWAALDTRAWRVRDERQGWPGFPDDLRPVSAAELVNAPRVTLWATPDQPRRRAFPEPGDMNVYRFRPFLQPGYVKPGPWGTEEWRRGSHLCVCDICGREYGRHPTETGPAYGSAGDERIELMRICDGRLVKP